MSTRKNLDKLFQEKFQDFEVNPPEFVWENIEEKLKEKKKRRVIPFWWISSGVAALFVVGLLIWNSNTNQIVNPSNDIVVNDNNKQNADENDTLDNKKSDVIASDFFCPYAGSPYKSNSVASVMRMLAKSPVFR